MYIISLDEEFNGKLKVVQLEVKYDLEKRVEQIEKKLNKHLELENKAEKDVSPLRFEFKI